MAEAFLESSVVIGLHFRHAGERERCASAIPKGAERVTSRYVIYEVARGFLRSVVALHNFSFEYTTFSALHEAAHLGQQRFKPYRMQTWLGSFDDYFAALEAEDSAVESSAALAELRAKLRTWARRGWQRAHAENRVVNPIGCQEDLKPPFVRSHDKRLDQALPTQECGTPAACGLDRYLAANRASLSALCEGLRQLEEIDKETRRRIEALDRLLAKAQGAAFAGKDCYDCGDAFICHESPARAVVVTKNGKHFVPMGELLGRTIARPR